MTIKIRKAKKADSKKIIELICELANFEKLPPPDENARKRLINHAFGRNPLFFILVAEVEGILAGYAFYFYMYSSFLAKKTLYLEDIFITKAQRNKGLGKKFMDELIRIAKTNKCGRIEWAVLDWNKNAIKFYEKFGVRELSEWKYYRISL
jgi:GNAT superfamily N-acetyltransferase